MKKIAIFASGNGSNTENIIKYFATSNKIKIALVLSNNPIAKVLLKAKKQGILTIVFNKSELITGFVLETLKKKKEISNDKAFNLRMLEAHPIGRIAKPEEVAKTIIFLASEDATFITGAILPVDGGRSVR
mgnify:CR=1 FL=1